MLSFKHIKTVSNNRNGYFIYMVGVVRLELTQYCYQRFLRPSRLPIPTYAHIQAL